MKNFWLIKDGAGGNKTGKGDVTVDDVDAHEIVYGSRDP